MTNPNKKSLITLGEGNTPLLRLRNLETAINWPGQLWGKAEYQNPTGSFKDRGSVAEITQALRQQKSGVVCASTGNMAASLSAYAAKAKLKCVVVVPQTTPPAKLRQIRLCGATIIKVAGNYDLCVAKARYLAQERDLLLCGDYDLRRQGQSSLGQELAQSDVNFNAFICPVGNGTIACAVAEGLAKYNQFPCFIGIQGQGADPLVRAWKDSLVIQSIKQPATIASAMNVGNPLDGQLVLNWAKRTNGDLISVSDTQIQSAQQLLAKTEGIFVESASAATVAALTKLKDKPTSIVLILTGSGLKEGGE